MAVLGVWSLIDRCRPSTGLWRAVETIRDAAAVQSHDIVRIARAVMLLADRVELLEARQTAVA